MLKDRMFRDTESGANISEQDLFFEFLVHSEEIRESSGATNFVDWLRNATSKDGFLEEV